MVISLIKTVTNKCVTGKQLIALICVIGLLGCSGEALKLPSVLMRTDQIQDANNDGSFLNTFVTSDGSEWNRFVHSDLPENTSGSMDRDRESGMLYLTFFYEKPDGSHALMAKWALGNQNWSEEHSEVAIAPPPPSSTPQIFYATDGKFVILWREGNRLHTALLDAAISPGQNLFLGETIEFNNSIVRDRYFSAGFYQGMVHILCMTSPEESGADRPVYLVRGQIHDTSLSFLAPVHTGIVGSMVTNLLTEDDSLMFILDRHVPDSEDPNFFEQVGYRSHTGNDWEIFKICQPPVSFKLISEPLFFRDGHQHLRYLRTELYDPEAGHSLELVNLTDCSAHSFNVSGLESKQFFRYSPGEVGFFP